ncbi:MAG TPA: NAD-dependent dehydratase [Candidatus Pacebacteria bacterium]|nr:MAG: NAD-dependent epimerase/dehydratase [Microgenomates group bacterium GW2011_GWF1_44_10]HAU99206.1 NAD-dependent dehydratase [Candidatus Paceibacterota bacterium]HAX01736.1 NAD-dependent dehydratase [Candidatus Paceibacterota bacterium]
MNFKGKRVIVTGSAGFIGSHLCDALLQSEAEVLGIDNLICGSENNLSNAKKHQSFSFINADVSLSPASYLPHNYRPDYVFHFASPASPPIYQKYPIETYLVNSQGTHQLLQYLVAKNPSARFVFASTSEVYGNPTVHPQPESYWGNVNPNGIRSCYDESKRMGETICGVHARSFAIDTRIVRIFNTYGPRIGKDDGRIIPNFISQALAGEPLTVYGSGKQTRSLCYIDDLVRGILLHAVSEKTKNETINLGNPLELTVLEIASLIIKQTRSSSSISYLTLPLDDPERRKPDISKAQSLLSWIPEVSVETGLQKTIQYFTNLG